MLARPEYQALINLAWDGTPDEIATNFKTHGETSLGKITLGHATNEQKEVEEAIYCYDQALG